MNSPAPGWHPDPTARHEYRYWDGTRWTDDVSDGGVTSNDPLDGGAPTMGTDAKGDRGAPTMGTDATAPFEPTQQLEASLPPPPFPSTPPPTPVLPASAPPPRKKRPTTTLITGLALVAVALVGGITWLLVKDDGHDSADTANVGERSGTTDTAGDAGSTTTAPDDGSTTTEPGNLRGLENEDAVVQAMASELEQAAGGVLTHDQAVCIAKGMVDEFGLSDIIAQGARADAFSDPDSLSQLYDIMTGCVPPDVLAKAGIGG